MRPLLLLALLSFPFSPAPVGAVPPALPGLTLTLHTDRSGYEQGEPIPITLRYTYTGTRLLAVKVLNYDRSGRIQDFGFTATDAAGKAVPDPTPFHGGILGGLSSAAKITPRHPYAQTVTLNEWLRFDAPGRYTVTARSGIVHLDDGSAWLEGPSLSLTSFPLTIQITLPDEAHRQARLASARGRIASKDQDTRLNALRDLRFMVDARAIPLLVQGLRDPYANAVYEASFGLRAFPDLAPVRAEILRQVADPALLIPPSQEWASVSLLAEADLRGQGKEASFGDPASQKAFAHWQEVFAQRLHAQLPALSPGRAAEITVEGLAQGGLSHTDPAVWRRVLDNAARMSPASQQYAGSLMETVQDYPRSFPDIRALRALQPELRRVRANPHLDPALRSSAIQTLHALGDDAFRDRVAADLVSPKPFFTDAAHRTLGGYKAGAIGWALLMLAASPDFDIRASAAQRLRDFGGTVPARALRALMAREEKRNDWEARDAVLEALALASPAEALPFLQRQVNAPDRTYMGTSDVPIRLLCRMHGREARRTVRGLLAAPRSETRQTVAQALDQSWLEASQPAQRPPGRHLAPDGALAAFYIPELMALARNDPSSPVRAAARQALIGITGLPKTDWYQATPAQQQSWIPLWKGWWQKNQARFAPK